MPKPVSPATVQGRLTEEAARFNREHRGHHEFKPVWPAENDPACNWTTSYAVRGSSIALSKMRDALQRVQAEFPQVKFPAP